MEKSNGKSPRGILVVDVGYTNSKAVLFDADLKLVAERKLASQHVEGKTYKEIDPAPFEAFLKGALPELDALLPVDCIVPCAHGAAQALLRDDHTLAFPVMDYMSAPPADVVADYRSVQPPFSEVYCPLLPVALTNALQLFWMQRIDPTAFASATTFVPWAEYWGLVLSGVAACEISSMGCQTQLVDVNTGDASSLAKSQGWDRLYAPHRKAWDVLGPCLPQFGLGRPVPVLAGIHDSNANYLRYLAAGLSDFTLLSTGTWSICFNSAADIAKLVPEKDTNTNTDVFGRPVGCSRFFAGKELELVSQGAAASAASMAVVQSLVTRGSYALPSFSDSGGPVVGTGLKGRFAGPASAGDDEKASLAILYCALMVSCQLDAAQSQNQIIVDGPFSQNPIFLRLLAQLRPGQAVSASTEHNGTATGAACLALMPNGALPLRPIVMEQAKPAGLVGLEQYQKAWLNQIATG